MNKNINVGFIGCGSIAHFHADVLLHLGVNISCVSARPDSENLKAFQKKYDIKSSYTSWQKMLEDETLDAIWVLASWDVIDEIFIDVLSYEIPVFFEKPIALSGSKIENAIRLFPEMLDKVQVGYNRRFYDFIPKIKAHLSEIEINSVEIYIPESSFDLDDENWIKNLFLQNSSHVIDLLLILLDEYQIKVDKVYRTRTKDKNLPKGYNAILLANNSFPIHLVANWNCPSNFGIKIHSDNLLIELLPIEMVNVYEGFEIIEPTKDNPIRRYKPKIKNQYFIENESAKFKPGFLKQTINFLDTCVYNKYKNSQAGDLESTLNTTLLCEEIMG